jgi:DNA-binding transcriptional ArsR family regulator
MSAMQDEWHEPEREEISLPTVLGALADPARLALLRALHEVGESNCGALTALSGLDLSKSTVSHHLRVLREAGVTHTQFVGTSRRVSIRQDDLEVACPGLLHAVIGSHVHA